MTQCEAHLYRNDYKYRFVYLTQQDLQSKYRNKHCKSSYPQSIQVKMISTDYFPFTIHKFFTDELALVVLHFPYVLFKLPP